MAHIVKLIDSTEQFQQACCHMDDNRCATWIPYEVNASGIIVHDITGEVFDLGKEFYANFWHGPLEDKPQTIASYFGKLMDMKERLAGQGPTSRRCGMCMIPTSVKNSTIVKLRGVCKFSAFDTQYQVAVSPEGEVIYYGLARTIISYSHTLEAWKIIDVINPNIFGILTAGFSGLALGTNKWTIRRSNANLYEDIP